ncbi:MAG: long-chain fatty aldehyde decarbonylase [bacterium]|nr:long-chain fatty aldehyde decarbonylase [bacterium]
MGDSVTDLHRIEPEEFSREVHSFEYWFRSVEGYLSERPYGHRPDLKEPERTPEERERLISILSSYCVGELASLEGSSGLVAIAPNSDFRVFLATQAVDEARHLEVLRRRLADLGADCSEAALLDRAMPPLRAFRRRLHELIRARDWEAALLAQNVILEAMEFAAFQSHAEATDPITREILEGIIKDERRHIGFGENEIGRRLQETPHIRARLSQVRAELDPLVLQTFSDTLAAIGVDASEEQELGRRYLAAVDRLELRE